MIISDTHVKTKNHETLDKLDRFMDGQLSPGEAVMVRNHLARCESCAGEYQRRLQVRERLRQAVCSQDPSPYLHTRLSARLREHQRYSLGIHWRTQIAAVGCGTLG
jgi:anti-sigma factor RsiW